MRGSAWTLPILAMALWLAAVGWPAAAAIEAIARQSPSGRDITDPWSLLALSAGWAVAVALGAMLLGWAPGRLLGRAIARRGFVPLAVFMLAPIVLPAYVIFFAWWQAWPAGTGLYRSAVEHEVVPLVRQGTLLVGFLCWSWPIVAWCVAGSVAQTPIEREELLRVDGAGPLRRLLDRLRCDGRGLLIGGLIAFLITFNNTTCFDLAEIFTFGNELRAMEALGATNRDVLMAAAPATLLTMAGAVVIWLLLGTGIAAPAVRTGRPSLVAGGYTALLWIIAVAFPLVLLARNLRLGAGGRDLHAQIDEFRAFYGQGLMNTIGIALVTALLAGVVAVGLAWMWQDRRAWVRWLAHGQAVVWMIAAAVPGTMVGVAMQAGYNRGPFVELVYMSPAVLVLGHLARFAFLGALLGRWVAAREPRSLMELRQIDGADRLVGLMRATWPRLAAAAAAVFGISFVLSLSEIPVTAAVRPPGLDLITPSILNDMHFQRPQTVMLASAIFVVLAIVAALITVTAWLGMGRGFGGGQAFGNGLRRKGRVTMGTVCAVLLVLPFASGCGAVDPDDVPPLRTQMIFGSAGRGTGQFYYPRGITIDWDNRYIYVVDRSSRIQRYDFDGRPHVAWQMPNWEMGFPTGIQVGPDGNVYLADTHYFRVVVFDPKGNEVMRFGEYGTEPGQFIYTTDIAFGPEGRIYVAETGGNDRIQVFTPEGEYLFEFGEFGAGQGQFSRPQALAFSHDLTELYIADSCNHRIVVTDPEGNWLRTIGSPGRGHGQLSYPYDVLVLHDGTIFVCEFHNNRIQKFGPDGSPRGLYGRVGFRKGELQFPWALDGNADLLFVVDSGNNRVQMVRTP